MDTNNKTVDTNNKTVGDTDLNTKGDTNLNTDIISLVEVLSNEIPTIGLDNGDMHCSNTATDNVVSMMQSLERGEEPIMFKICSGIATETEISDWAKSQEIDPEDIDKILPMIISSFSAGPKIVRDIRFGNLDTSNPSNPSNRSDNSNINTLEIIEKLKNVERQLDDLKWEVKNMIKQLSPNPDPFTYP